MKDDAPYYMHKVECPVCKAINEFETIRVGAYEEKGRDTDFRPTGITWKNPKYQRYNPTLFFMATCSNCYFTREYTSKFRDWKSDNAFKNYRLKHLKSEHVLRLAEEESAIRMLGEKLDARNYPLQTAINKLLLGIFDELLSDKPSNLDVGRYFLRAAWLFRESSSEESGMHDVALSYASNLEERVRILDRLHDRLGDSRQKLKPILDDLLEHGASNISADPGIQERCQHAMTFLAGAGDQLASAISTLKATINMASDNVDTVCADGTIAAPYDEYESYYEFLGRLREQWELVPLSEHDALRFSHRFYKESYECGREISAGNQQIQVEYLLGELCRRLGLNQEAKHYFNHAVKSAQAFIYEHKGDKARTALASRILEMALAQGKLNLQKAKQAAPR